MPGWNEIGRDFGAVAIVVVGVALVAVGLFLTVSGVGTAFGPPVVILGVLALLLGRKVWPD